MTPESMLRPFLHLLNREADAGEIALQALRSMSVTEWPQYFATRPGWRSYGVFRSVLSYARELFYSDPPRALAVTTFVIEQIENVNAPPDAMMLGPFIRGLAWKEHANALHGLGRHAEAAAAAERAIGIFGDMPALAVDVAWASLVRAMSLHSLHDTREALDLIMKSVRLFAAHAEPRGYRVSLQVCGGILADLDEYAAARDAFSVAHKIAQEQNDPREVAQTLNNIGQCSVRLGELELGEQQLQQAFRLFGKEHMNAEMVRTVAALTSAQYKQGLRKGPAEAQAALDRAISTFHMVYGDLLHYGMLIPAAQVLVELTDVITVLTGDLAYARNECAQLAASFGDYDVPGSVRTAMAYVHHETAAATSVEQVRVALRYVQSFLKDFLASPSTAFAVPA